MFFPSNTRRISGILYSVLLASLIAPSSVHADSPWLASWIGPSVPEPVGLADASWIWSDEPGVDPTAGAPSGSRVFRREFEITGQAAITSATMTLTADNAFKLVVNGQVIGTGNNWEQPGTFDVTAALRLGGNRIAIEAENVGEANPAGLIGKLHIERAGLPAQVIVTDAQWSCAGLIRTRVPVSSGIGKKAEPAWRPAKVLGGLGAAPWGAVNTATTGATNVWTCFRKSISLAEKPASAPARIAVDSKYWLWVNGELAVYEGGLKRGPNPQDTYYDVVDLAPYLRQGENTIALLAWFWGKEGYSHKNSGKAGMVFDMTAGATRVLSDATWKALRHPSFGKTGEPHPNYRLPEENIHFDARLDPGNWQANSFNDAAWPTADAFGVPPVSPWNQLVQRPIPQWRRTGLVSYTNPSEFPAVSTGQPIIARLPVNLTISPYLKINAPAGLTIDMRTDNYKGGSEYNYRAEYITKEGVQEFESPAYLNGHWMIYSIPAGVEIIDLKYRETRYDTDYTGSFTCNDPFLNSLWMKARNTMNLNMRDCIQDPDRERAQWWGDLVILMPQIFNTCDARAHALIRKGIDNLVDWQKPDGVLFSPIPAGSWNSELPQQMLASIGMHGFWNYYLHTGDQAAITRSYPAVKRYLALWQLGSNGLVVHRPGGWDWADWGENIDVPVIENAWLYQALEAAILMARLSGQDADVPGYEATRASILANYNRVLWNGSAYRSPGYTGQTDERGHALAVLHGLATPAQWPAIKQVFASQFHASPYMEKYVLQSLFHMGEDTAAIARMKSRYQNMVASEYSTLWEGWGIGAEGYGGGSYNHGWAGGPLALMMQYVTGVKPLEPAYARFVVEPQMAALVQASTTVSSLKGAITVSIQRASGQFTLTLASPAATKAVVKLPVTGAVTINGQPAATVSGVVYQGRVGNREVFEVDPGSWIFTAQEN